MSLPKIGDRLQPALLDRLRDDDPDNPHEAPDMRVMSRARLREVVLRDLSWLFNSNQPPDPRPMLDTINGSMMSEADKVLARRRLIIFDDLPPCPDGVSPLGEPDTRPHAQRSVLNYGLPALSGLTASSVDAVSLENMVYRAILDHEPRILPHTLKVEVLIADEQLDHHNQISFRITGQMWAQPLPLELLLHTDVDLETGRVDVKELQR